MKLLDSLPILISISRIALHVNATFPAIRSPQLELWFPGPDESQVADFMQDVHAQSLPETDAPRRHGCFPLGLGSSSTSRTRSIISPVPHAEAVKSFRGLFHSKRTLDDRATFLTGVFRYLAVASGAGELTEDLVLSWCHALAEACFDPDNHPAHRLLIYNGLHTLILQNYRNDHLTPQIYFAAQQIEASKTIWDALQGPDGLTAVTEWWRETFFPEKGFSAKWDSWENINQLLRNEPNLSNLREAIKNGWSGPDLVNGLRSMERIFSNPPPKNVSAETRVAAIGLLSRAMFKTKQIRTEVFNSITRLLDQNNHFLFPHEETLLDNLARTDRS